MRNDILKTINEKSLEENGKRVTEDSKLKDLDLDSFGYTVLMFELDDIYNIFDDVPSDVDPFTTISWDTMTIRELVDKCL